MANEQTVTLREDEVLYFFEEATSLATAIAKELAEENIFSEKIIATMQNLEGEEHVIYKSKPYWIWFLKIPRMNRTCVVQISPIAIRRRFQVRVMLCSDDLLSLVKRVSEDWCASSKTISGIAITIGYPLADID